VKWTASDPLSEGPSACSRARTVGRNIAPEDWGRKLIDGIPSRIPSQSVNVAGTLPAVGLTRLH